MNATEIQYASYDEALEDYFQRGWTDGLPIVPPTPDAVGRFLEAGGSDPSDVLGALPTRDVVVTAELVAINAVMAGCKAEYMPVVLAATRAQLSEVAQCHSTTATLWSASQVVIVNGPVRHWLDIACGVGCFGPGYRANATIGRALRLVMRNVCHSIPGAVDRAVFSTPDRYSFCFGENQEASDWVPLHVERGVTSGESAVTVISVVPSPILVYEVTNTARDILDSLANALINDPHSWRVELMGGVADYPIVLSPRHASQLAEVGHTKATVRAYIWDALEKATARDGRVCRIGRPEGLVIVVAGGDGGSISNILTPHVGLAVTEVVK